MSIRQAFKALGIIGWFMGLFETWGQLWRERKIKQEAYDDGHQDAEYDAMRENAEAHRRARAVDDALAHDPNYRERMRRKYEAEGSDGK